MTPAHRKRAERWARTSLERGCDLTKDPNAFAKGLDESRRGAAKYSEAFRQHDKLGH